jgi:hypothetical protein
MASIIRITNLARKLEKIDSWGSMWACFVNQVLEKTDSWGSMWVCFVNQVNLCYMWVCFVNQVNLCYPGSKRKALFYIAWLGSCWMTEFKWEFFDLLFFWFLNPLSPVRIAMLIISIRRNARLQLIVVLFNRQLIRNKFYIYIYIYNK